jgi:hypothetical protein
MPTPRVPFANFCPVCGVNSKQLQPETTLSINEYNPWTCRACGYQWVMVARGASLQGHWNRPPTNPLPSSSWLARPSPNGGGPAVVGRLIRTARGRR